MIVLLYLFSAVFANLVVTLFGPNALFTTALIFIPLDLSTRDILHERWNGSKIELASKLGCVMLLGSVLSYAVNRNSKQVAIASLVSFLLAGITDTVVYEALKFKAKFWKMNGSNFFSSIVDSLVFPFVAFNMVDFGFSAKQAAFKFCSGLFWSFILARGTR